MTPSKTYRRYERNRNFIKRAVKSGALMEPALAETNQQVARNCMFVALQNTEIAKARAEIRARMIVQQHVNNL